MILLSVHTYADDCALIISDKDQTALEKKIVDVVKLTRHWFDCNNLKVNLTKSFLMHVRTCLLYTSDAADE